MKTKQIEIQVPWGFIKGQVFGDQTNPNAIPILCLHGYLDNSNSFKPLARHLCVSNEYYMIAIDYPGHGLSSKLNDPLLYTLRTFVLAVRKVVVDLNLNNFVFLTHSFGCTLAMMVFNYFFFFYEKDNNFLVSI